mmetsp:Transcript_29427/g.67672  ORF Transcript_29427/g.67672 Transcript_29427/m.67672 type:complete len:135 (-) Transcript_29427:193-597(-)
MAQPFFYLFVSEMGLSPFQAATETERQVCNIYYPAVTCRLNPSLTVLLQIQPRLFQATHGRSSVSSGTRNRAESINAPVLGGVLNKVVGKYVSVSGRRTYFANGETSTISGEVRNKGDNKYSSTSSAMEMEHWE